MLACIAFSFPVILLGGRKAAISDQNGNPVGIGYNFSSIFAMTMVLITAVVAVLVLGFFAACVTVGNNKLLCLSNQSSCFEAATLTSNILSLKQELQEALNANATVKSTQDELSASQLQLIADLDAELKESLQLIEDEIELRLKVEKNNADSLDQVLQLQTELSLTCQLAEDEKKERLIVDKFNSSLLQRINEIEQENATFKADSETLRASNADLMGRNEYFSTRIVELESLNTDLNIKLNDERNVRESMENCNVSLNDRITTIEETSSALQTQLNLESALRQATELCNQEYQQNIQTMVNNIDSMKIQLENEIATRVKSEAANEMHKTRIIQLESENEDQSVHLQINQKALEESLEKLADMERENDANITEMLVDKGELLSKMNDLQQRTQSFVSQEKSISESIEDKDKEIATLNANLKLCHTEFQELCFVNNKLESDHRIATAKIIEFQNEVSTANALVADLSARLEESRSLFQSAEQNFSESQLEHHKILTIMTVAINEANSKILSLESEAKQQLDTTSSENVANMNKLMEEINTKNQFLDELTNELAVMKSDAITSQQLINDQQDIITKFQESTSSLTKEIAILTRNIDLQDQAKNLQIMVLENENRRFAASLASASASAALSPIKKLETNSCDLQCKIEELETRLKHVTEENQLLAGHNNSKQKIQQLMQLKRELTEQTAVIKQLREKSIAVTMERDTLLEELKTIRATSQAVVSTNDSVSQMVEGDDDDVSVVSNMSMSSRATKPNATTNAMGVWNMSTRTTRPLNQLSGAAATATMSRMTNTSINNGYLRTTTTTASRVVKEPTFTGNNKGDGNAENVVPTANTLFAPTQSSLAKRSSSAGAVKTKAAIFPRNAVVQAVNDIESF